MGSARSPASRSTPLRQAEEHRLRQTRLLRQAEEVRQTRQRRLLRQAEELRLRQAGPGVDLADGDHQLRGHGVVLKQGIVADAAVDEGSPNRHRALLR